MAERIMEVLFYAVCVAGVVIAICASSHKLKQANAEIADLKQMEDEEKENVRRREKDVVELNMWDSAYVGRAIFHEVPRHQAEAILGAWVARKKTTVTFNYTDRNGVACKSGISIEDVEDVVIKEY